MSKILEFCTIDGMENHQLELGSTGAELLQLLDDFYEDETSARRGGDLMNSSLSNPHAISDAVSKQTESVANFLDAIIWLWL